jgi:hypothetical protein
MRSSARTAQIVNNVKNISGNLACNDATKIRALRHRQSLHNIEVPQSIMATFSDPLAFRPTVFGGATEAPGTGIEIEALTGFAMAVRGG